MTIYEVWDTEKDISRGLYLNEIDARFECREEQDIIIKREAK